MEKIITVIGMMSGTSGDGIDVAVIKTDGNEFIENIGGFTYDYKFDLNQAINLSNNDIIQLYKLEHDITLAHIEAVEQLLNSLQLSLKAIDLIGMHGHTIYHSPEKSISIQLGNPNLLSYKTGVNVISDFRRKDIAAGGQGAPMVPIFHKLLAKKHPHPVSFVNIGGVANITYIDQDNIIAFDTGPGCALINDWVYRHYNMRYDKDGEIATQGNVVEGKLQEFLSDPYFKMQWPKSLDRNYFHYIDMSNISPVDGVATYTAFTYYSIARAIKMMPKIPNTVILVGGGRHNKTIMSGLQKLLPIKLTKADDIGINGDMLEAQAFGYIATRSLYNMPISLPSTTGANQPVIGGVFCPA